MARPIEPTPILEGEDAERFMKDLEEAETKPNPKKKAFLNECRDIYNNTKIRE